MNYKTPGHRVLIKPDDLGTVDPKVASAKQAGIYIPDKTERAEAAIIDTGVVLELGGTAFDAFGGREHWCKEGDRVSYTRYGGKILHDPENKEVKYLVVNDEDILMVWRNND
jgi:co-chaperonin GroES (HSP10)